MASKYPFGQDASERMVVYAITHIGSGKCYIGITTGRASKRWLDHISGVDGSRKKSSPLLVASMKKYGIGAFSFEVIDSAKTRDELARKEVFWIAQLKTMSPNGLNLTSGGDLNCEYSDEARRKIGAAHKGKKPSPETRAKISESLSGRALSAETIAKRTASVLGQKRSDETKARISASQNGKTHSQEVRDRISLSKLGVKQPPDVIERRAAALRGRKQDEAVVALRAARLQGKKRTVTQRGTIAQSQMGGKVVTCSNGKTYGSLLEASIDTGVGRNSIGNACAGLSKKAGGMRFSYVIQAEGGA